MDDKELFSKLLAMINNHSEIIALTNKRIDNLEKLITNLMPIEAEVECENEEPLMHYQV